MRWTARSAWRPVWLGLAMTAIALTLALSPASVATPSWPHDFIVVLGWVGTALRIRHLIPHCECNSIVASNKGPIKPLSAPHVPEVGRIADKQISCLPVRQIISSAPIGRGAL